MMGTRHFLDLSDAGGDALAAMLGDVRLVSASARQVQASSKRSKKAGGKKKKARGKGALQLG